MPFIQEFLAKLSPRTWAEEMRANPHSWLLPSLRDILFLAIFVAALLLGYRMLNMDGDLPRHLVVGRFIAQTGAVPTSEPFVYTYFGKPFVPSEWLGEFILYIAYALAGLPGVALLSALTLAATFTLLYAELSSRLNLRIPVLLLVVWGAAVTSLHWIARPHLISMLLLVLCLIWTDRLARGEKVPIWWLPVLIAVWANVHGEFIVGELVIFAYAAGWTWDYLLKAPQTPPGGWKLWPTLLLCILSSFINPTGPRPWLTITGFLSNHYMMTHMAETNAPNFQDSGLSIVLALVAFSIFLLAAKAGRFSSGRAFLLAGFTIMVLTTIRNVHLYGIVAPFVLVEALGGIHEIKIFKRIEASLGNIERQLKGALWLVVISLILGTFVLTSDVARRYYRFDEAFFPVQAVNWLKANPQQGNMFNNLDWGGYINLSLWPEHPAFLDSVADMSGDISHEYEAVIMLSNRWQDILRKYNVDWIIFQSDSLLARQLESDPNWETVYDDSMAVILRKK